MSVTDVIDLGTPVVLYGTFITASGVLYDPPTVRLDIVKADGTTTTLGPDGGPPYASFTELAVGRVSYTITAVDVAGVWTYTWTAAGGDIDTGHFLVGDQAATDGPCDDWCRAEDIFSCSPLEGATPNYNLAQDAVEQASRILYLLSERRYPGICRATVRPCLVGSWDVGWPGYLQTGIARWGGCGCGATIRGACGCGGTSELLLSPEYRVLGVVSVYEDGVELASSAYRIDDDRYLVRLDGEAWRSSQDLILDPHAEADTFEVTYWFGQVPPADGKRAAAALAAQIYSECSGGDCVLPTNIRSRVRRGDAIDFGDLEGRGFNVSAVDRFLEAELAGLRTATPFVVSPDRPAGVRRIGT